MKKIFLFLLMILLSPAFAQDGHLITSYNPNLEFAQIRAMDFDNSGRLLISGYNSQGQPTMLRILPNGTQDSTFNPPAFTNGISAFCVESNGNILIGTPQTGNTAIIRRISDTGNLQPFSSSLPTNFIPEKIVIQPVTNKIIVAGAVVDNVVGKRMYRLNTNGVTDTTFNNNATGINLGGITDIIMYPTGEFIVGGNFDSYNGIARQNIAKINANGTLNSFNITGITNFVFALALQSDGKILIGGDFTHTPSGRQYLIRTSSTGVLDTNFAPSQVNSGYIHDIELQNDGKILIGGQLSFANSTTKGLMRLTTNGIHDTCFDSGTAVKDPGLQSSRILKLAIDTNQDIYIAGELKFYNGASISDLAKIQGTTQVDAVNDTATAAPGTEAIANILANDTFNGTTATLATVTYTPLTSSPALSFTTAGKILVAANAAPGTYSVNYQICRKSTNCNCDTATVTVTVTAPAVQIIANDDTATIDYPLTDTIVLNALTNDTYNGNPATTSNVSFAINTSSSEYIYIDIASGNVYIAANAPAGTHTFTYIIKDLNNPANNDTATVTIIINEPAPASGIRANNNVFKIEKQNSGQTIITGNFSSYDNIAANKIVRLNSNLTYDWNFYSSGPGPDQFSSIVNFDIENDDSIIVIGDFTQFDGTNIGRGIARLSFNGYLDTYTFDSGTGFEILSNTSSKPLMNGLDIQTDGKIIIGGYFDTYNGVSRNGLIRLNSNGTVDNTFNIGTGFTNFNGPSYGPGDIVVQPDGKILIAGNFSNYNGSAMNKVGRLNADGSIDTSFSAGTGITDVVGIRNLRLLLQPDGKIILYGTFTSYNGTAKSCIVRLNSNGSVDNTFTAIGASTGNSTNPQISTVSLQADGKYIVGGNFTLFNGTTVNRLIRLNANGSVDTSFVIGTGPNGNVIDTFIQNNGKILVGGVFTTYNGITVNRITRIAPTTPGVESRGLQIWDNDPELEMTASTDSFLNSNEVSIYPNPSTGVFNLALNGHDGTQFDVTVHNSLGQLVYKGKVMAGTVSQIDLQGLQQGNYFVQLQSSNTTINKIITKK